MGGGGAGEQRTWRKPRFSLPIILGRLLRHPATRQERAERQKLVQSTGKLFLNKKFKYIDP